MAENDTNPYAKKNAKLYTDISEFSTAQIEAVVKAHGPAMWEYYLKQHAEGMSIDSWTAEDSLRLINTRVGRAALAKQSVKDNWAKLKGYFKG